MMDEFEDVRKLIRLKRFERPPQGYTEGFLVEFHRRQREELLKRSAHGLFFERVATYASGFGRQKWIAGGGLAYAALMAGYLAWPTSAGSNGSDNLASLAGDTGGTFYSIPQAPRAPLAQPAGITNNLIWGQESNEIGVEFVPLHPVLTTSNVHLHPVNLELTPDRRRLLEQQPTGPSLMR